MHKRFLYILLVFCFPPQPACGQRVDSIVVYFDFNRWEIAPGADSALHLLERAGRDPSRISLSGYCDAVGSNGYNDTLSMRRALAVRRYLLRGLPASAITEVRGFGKRQPLNENLTREERAMNRRVVVVVEFAAGDSAPPVAGKPSSGHASPPRGPISAALKDSATAVGTSLVLKNVNFYGGRHFPLDSAYAALNDLLRAMRDNPRLVIRIEGYVCCTPDSMDGPDLDTRKPNLSVARARFVYDYLLQHGIDSARMSYVGFGGANKIYPLERDPTEMALNRRVEVRVMAR
jgi:outer membrane protein OmpA-like peptidoglycan-associated protein